MAREGNDMSGTEGGQGRASMMGRKVEGRSEEEDPTSDSCRSNERRRRHRERRKESGPREGKSTKYTGNQAVLRYRLQIAATEADEVVGEVKERIVERLRDIAARAIWGGW